MKYRTLCAPCNNTLLGQRYDPTLIAYANDVAQCLASRLDLRRVAICTKPNRLVRSIVGHLLAYGLDAYRSGELIGDLSDFFLDERAVLPPQIRLYQWVYPYPDQVIVKCAAMAPSFPGDSFAVFQLMKFYPLSFLFVLDEPSVWRLPYQRLDTCLSSAIDDESEIDVNFQVIPPQRFPEAPTSHGVVLHGDWSAITTARQPSQFSRLQGR
jgi:hypothetical protein